MEIGEKIRRARESQKPRVSQRELANRIKSSREHISALENGRVSPTWDTIERIAKALGYVSVDSMLGNVSTDSILDDLSGDDFKHWYTHTLDRDTRDKSYIKQHKIYQGQFYKRMNEVSTEKILTFPATKGHWADVPMTIFFEFNTNLKHWLLEYQSYPDYVCALTKAYVDNVEKRTWWPGLHRKETRALITHTGSDAYNRSQRSLPAAPVVDRIEREAEANGSRKDLVVRILHKFLESPASVSEVADYLFHSDAPFPIQSNPQMFRIWQALQQLPDESSDEDVDRLVGMIDVLFPKKPQSE